VLEIKLGMHLVTRTSER